MKKRNIISLILAFVMILTFVPSAYASDVQTALDSIDITAIIPDVTVVSEDFVLPIYNEDENVTFSWDSSDSEVLKIFGKHAFIVSNPREREVTLKVTATNGVETKNKSFVLNVEPATYTGEYIIDENFENVSEGFLPDDGKWGRDSFYNESQANVKQNDEWVSFMGVTEKEDGKSLRVFRKSGYSHAAKIIHSVYACFGEIDKDAELIVTYDMLIDNITNDAMGPRFTTSPTNTLGSTFAGITPLKNGAQYQFDISKNRMPFTLSTWNEVAYKARMSSDTSSATTYDAYVNDYEYKNIKIATDKTGKYHTYIQNMMFGTDTEAKKGIDMYVDNVKVFLNGAQQIADKITYETIGATEEGNVFGNLVLDSEFDGAKVSYICSEEGRITSDGIVTHPSSLEGNKSLTLYIVVEKDGYKGFSVLPLSIIAHDEVTENFFAIDIENMLENGEKFDNVVSDFNLLDRIDEYELTWESSDEDVIKIENSYEAKVIRNLNDMPVTLTAKMEKEGTTLVKEFELTVKKIDAGMDIDSIVGGNASAVTDDFILPDKTTAGDNIIWESSDENVLFVFDNKAYVFPGSEEKEVILSAGGIFDGVAVKLDYELKVSPITVENDILVDEDFEDTEIGMLPDTKLKDGDDMWVLNSSVTANDPNQYNIVVKEDSVLSSEFLDSTNKGNKVLQAGKKEVDNTQALVHLLLDSPMETVVNLEFDVFAEGSSHGHIWITNNQGTALSGDLVRIPMTTRSIVLTDVGGVSKRLDYAKNTWHNMKLTVDMSNYKYDCYVDGKLEVDDGPVKENGNILSSITFGFGKGLWGYNLVDNVKIWVDIEKSVGAFTESIDLGDISQVTSDIKLPALTPCGDAEITWLSSNPTVLNSSGRVIRPASNEPDANVELYALVKANNIRVLKKFDVTVKSEKTDAEAAQADFNNLVLDTNGLLTKDVPLHKKGIYGSDIIWESSHPEIINPVTGKLSQKQFDNMQITSVTLTAYVKKGNETSEKKSFVFNVPERNYALNSTVDGSSDRIDTPFKNVTDNDLNTSWGPKSDDEEKYIILTLPNATTTTTKIDKISTVGTFDGVTVYISNTTSGDAFTKVGTTGNVELDSSVEAKRVKLEFSGDNVDVSSVGIYFTADDNKLAKEDADCVDLGNTGNITGNIILPVVGEKNGSTITWKSDKPEILADDGKLLSVPAVRTMVQLTMTAKYGTTGEAVRTFNVYVAGMTISGTTGGGGGGSFGGGNNSVSSYGSLGTYTGGASAVVPQIYYNDISDFGWAKQYIEEFAQKEILSVPVSKNFEPERAITRAEFLKILLLALNITAGNEKEISFMDVSSESWYYDIVKRGVYAGIVSGVSEAYFMPDANITRQDIAVMVLRALAYCGRKPEENKQISFNDSNEISQYAYDAVMSLGAAEIINGYENGSFAPKGIATRAEAVVLVGRAAK